MRNPQDCVFQRSMRELQCQNEKKLDRRANVAAGTGDGNKHMTCGAWCACGYFKSRPKSTEWLLLWSSALQSLFSKACSIGHLLATVQCSRTQQLEEDEICGSLSPLLPLRVRVRWRVSCFFRFLPLLRSRMFVFLCLRCFLQRVSPSARLFPDKLWLQATTLDSLLPFWRVQICWC